MKFYLLSLRWTHPEDLLFTFSKADPKDFSWLKHEFGIFSQEETGKPSPKTFIIEKSVVDGLCVPIMVNGKVFHGLPVNEYTLQEMGLWFDDLMAKKISDFQGLEFVLENQTK